MALVADQASPAAPRIKTTGRIQSEGDLPVDFMRRHLTRSVHPVLIRSIEIAWRIASGGAIIGQMPEDDDKASMVLPYSTVPVASSSAVVWCRLLALVMLGWGVESAI